MNACAFDDIAILLQAGFYNPCLRTLQYPVQNVAKICHLSCCFFKQVEFSMIVNKHLQKSSNGVGLGAQHCRKCPSNIWIETFSGVIVEDEEADPMILDLPFTLALPIYFGMFSEST